jgi:hypothetical protein
MLLLHQEDSDRIFFSYFWGRFVSPKTVFDLKNNLGLKIGGGGGESGKGEWGVGEWDKKGG